jgi:hypothetical protein
MLTSAFVLVEAACSGAVAMSAHRWWQNGLREVEVSFTVTNVCTSFEDRQRCKPIF